MMFKSIATTAFLSLLLQHAPVASAYQQGYPLRKMTTFQSRSSFLPTATRKDKDMSLQMSMMDGSIFTAIDSVYHSQPYLSAFVTCAVKASTADWLAQSKQHSTQSEAEQNEGSSTQMHVEDMDFLRNLAFVVYGGFYQGMAQTFIYTHVFPLLFGHSPTVASVLMQVATDIFILAPFVCLPTVYTLKSVLSGGTPSEGVSKYIDHIYTQDVLIRYWSIWFPAQCINFGIVPEHLRVLFSAGVSFFWMCLLSFVSSQDTGKQSTERVVANSPTNGFRLELPASIPVPQFRQLEKASTGRAMV